MMVFASGLLYFVMNHSNIERADSLAADLQRLRKENEDLAEENRRLRKRVDALRDDPRLAERRARETASLARPGEVIYQFEKPAEQAVVEVRLRAEPGRVELAGNPVALDALEDALRELKRTIPGARLKLSFGEGLGPIEKQRIRDFATESSVPIAPEE